MKVNSSISYQTYALKGKIAEFWGPILNGIVDLKTDYLTNASQPKDLRVILKDLFGDTYKFTEKSSGTTISEWMSQYAALKQIIMDSPKSGVTWRKIISKDKTALAISKPNEPIQYFIKKLDNVFEKVG